MSLLAPLFLLGALAIAAPIVAHLVRRATRERVKFSATHFLEASPPRLDRRSRIEHPWLLLLRCLVLLVLAAGFARPFLRETPPAIDAGTRLRHTVAVLDQSASMQRSGLWRDATERVRKIATSLGPADRFALITAGRTSSVILSTDTWSATATGDRESLLDATIGACSAGWDATHLDTAIDAALEEITAMGEAGGPSTTSEIVVISDFADGSRIAGLAGRDWPSDVTVNLEALPAPGTLNASLHWLGWITSPDGTLNARLRIAHDSDAATPYQIELQRAEDQRALADPLTLTLAPRETRAISIPIPSGHSSPLQVTLAGDAESFDNTLWLVPPQVHTHPLPYLGSGDTSDPRSALFYISRATAGWREPAVELQTFAPDSDAVPEAPLYLVTAPLAQSTGAALRARLEAGAFALVLVRDESLLATVNQLAATDGWSLGVKSNRPDAILADIQFSHPLFAPFADPRFSDFTRMRFWKTVPIRPPDAARNLVVARFDDGSPAVIETPVGRGRLVIWAGDWTPAASQWVLSTKFVPWFQSLTRRAAGGPPPPTMADVGSVDPLQLPAGTAVPRAPGVVRIDTGDRPRWVALNVPPSESRSTPIPLDAWEALGVPLATLDRASAAAAEQRAQQTAVRAGTLAAAKLEADQKLWRWLLLAAVVVLAIESIVAIRAATNRAQRAQGI